MQLFFRFKANLYVSVMACISGIQQNILKENSYEARYIYIHRKDRGQCYSALLAFTGTF